MSAGPSTPLCEQSLFSAGFHDIACQSAQPKAPEPLAQANQSVPSGTSFPSIRIVLSEPFGADCIPGGVSPWGLDAGAPPDLVLSGPVFPCGCVTFPLGSVFVDGSLGFDWEKATDTADKAKAAVKAMIARDMAHL
jgi:hypothetical protein